jgi:hypothetical protein
MANDPIQMQSKDAAEEFRVVIFYDRLGSVGPAMAAFSHLTRELEGRFPTGLRLWRIDVASLPECKAEANSDIESASMVIMAARRPQAGPRESADWAGDRGVGHSQRPVADPPGTAAMPFLSPGTWNHILRGATAQIQMDVFLWVPRLAQRTGAIEFTPAARARGGKAPGLAPTPGGPSRSLGPRRPIDSGIRGARLYRVTRPDGRGSYWETEVTLGAEPVRRRFASELHARAWLAGADDPPPMPSALDLEELNGRFRSPCFIQ